MNKVAEQNNSLSQKLLQINQLYENADHVFKIAELLRADELLELLNDFKNNFAWYEKLAIGGGIIKEEYVYFESQDYRNRLVYMPSLYVTRYPARRKEITLLLLKNKKDLVALQDR